MSSAESLIDRYAEGGALLTYAVSGLNVEQERARPDMVAAKSAEPCGARHYPQCEGIDYCEEILRQQPGEDRCPQRQSNRRANLAGCWVAPRILPIEVDCDEVREQEKRAARYDIKLHSYVTRGSHRHDRGNQPRAMRPASRECVRRQSCNRPTLECN